MKRAALAVFFLFLAFWAHNAEACFGTRLKFGIEAGKTDLTAVYAAGFFVEEKTGIAPEFVETGAMAEALAKGDADIFVQSADASIPGRDVTVFEAGTVPGPGKSVFVIRNDALDDIRFTTLKKALGLMPAFFGSKHYSDAAGSGLPPKKAARKAVSDGT